MTAKEYLQENALRFILPTEQVEGTSYLHVDEICNAMIDFARAQTIEITGADKPFPLVDVLQHLINASEKLLHKHNYDGGDYEEIEICVKRAKEIQLFLTANAELIK